MRSTAKLCAVFLLLTSGAAMAQAPAAFDQVVDRVIQKEHQFVDTFKQYAPITETYIQDLRVDKELGAVPTKDQYFLGRFELADGPKDRSFLPSKGFAARFRDKLTDVFGLRYLPLGFAEMVLVDGRDFDRNHYDFAYQAREFLGDVRCIVIDVQPKAKSGPHRFQGRIWVEDQDYNIVRFNGTYVPKPTWGYFLHFDSWRLNMGPGVWLPAYVYSEESDLDYGMVGRHLRFKGQTRLWGYDLRRGANQQEYTQVLVESPKVQDKSGNTDFSPVQSERAWVRLAEDNIVNRLQQAGLLAPEGEVSKVLETVVNNLEITNKLDIDPPVRCRVLLTAPLESFTIGHTIVLSRGLIDVLPDEATLATVLAHEMGHILLGHRLDTKYAFGDRMLFADEKTFEKFHFKRDPREEEAADAKGMELLANSPYKDKLDKAGLFLKALQNRAPELPNLITAHLGNGVARSQHTVEMAKLMERAPKLEQNRVDQIAALPLGARVKLDPWNDRLEMAKFKQVPLVSAREKMSFEVTPIYPYITRVTGPEKERVAETRGR